METTPRPVIDSVVRSVCGREVERLVRLTGGGLNEAYRVEVADDVPVVVRIARRPVPWFTDEEHLMAQARGVGVPTPDVLGVEQVDHDGELLSFSILRLVPGRSLDELAGELPASDLERLVIDAGELLARVHSVVADRGIRHELEPPDERFVARVVGVAHEALGPTAATVVERGAARLRDEVMTCPAPRLSLAHGDFLPKHLLIDDGGAIVSVIDWELAGPGSPAFDLAHWEVSAGDGLRDRLDLVRHGYGRVADPDASDAGWMPAFAIYFALDVLGWRNPAPLARLQRCVDVIARSTAA
jgi:aminoglycoside phosphotransferase (APT) family kinase protein